MVTREGSLLQPVLGCLRGNEINGEVSYVEVLKARKCLLSERYLLRICPWKARYLGLLWQKVRSRERN